MKLFLALVNLFNSELINSTARAYCYAPDIFLQTPSYAQKANSLEDCNSRCSRDRACNFFQFNIRKHKCFFFKNQRKLRSSVTSTRTSLQHNALWVRVQQRHVQLDMHSNSSNEPWILSWARKTSVWDVSEWVGIMAIQVMFLTRLSLDWKALPQFISAPRSVFTLLFAKALGYLISNCTDWKLIRQ